MASDYDTQRVLGPVDGTEYSGGVGTPFIVNHPYTDQNYFIFTGWTSYDGSGRSVFVSEIAPDLTLSNIRMIVSAEFPGDLTKGGHLAAHAAWDEVHKQWLVLTSEDTPAETWEDPLRTRTGIYRFNGDFSNIQSYGHLLPPNAGHAGPSGQQVPISDCGVPMLRPAGSTEACFFYATSPYVTPFGGMIAIMHTQDYTADNITVDYNDYVFWSGKGSDTAVLQPIQVSPELIVVLIEDCWNHNLYEVRPVFLCGSPAHPACTDMYGVQAYGSIIPTFTTGQYAVGHPHLTIYPDGRFYNLFHTIFRECGPSFRHEIWCTRVPPSRVDPTAYAGFSARIYEGPVTKQGYFSKIIPGWFSRRLNVQIATEGGGTLQILEGSEFMDVEAEGPSRKVEPGHHIYQFADPQPYVRIGFTPATEGQRIRLAVSLDKG